MGSFGCVATLQSAQVLKLLTAHAVLASVLESLRERFQLFSGSYSTKINETPYYHDKIVEIDKLMCLAVAAQMQLKSNIWDLRLPMCVVYIVPQ